MLKNRSFFFGLGLGLILGAVLLQLMTAAAPADKSGDSGHERPGAEFRPVTRSVYE
jgi:hypothetical protein